MLLNKRLIPHPWLSVPLFMALILLISCSKPEKPVSPGAVQKTFASPADAGAALLTAAKSGNRDALLEIFGSDGKDVLFSNDTVKDQNNLKDFIASYEQMHRWGDLKAGGKLLYTGADNYPFPIPLDRNSSGQWLFDTAAGKDEILARRIGKGELTALAACSALVAAQKQYFSRAHDGSKVRQYAQKFVSDEGKQDGLYWPVQDGQPPSPLNDLRDLAQALGYANSVDNPQLFDGYYYRILTKQGDGAKGGAKDYLAGGKMTGGFAILAYPAQYRNSGIMTFIVGTDGIIYQKDLGEKTTDTAAAMTEYSPGQGWTPAL
jgi:hypothetical protein